MAWRIPLSTATSIVLNAGDTLYVAPDVDVYVGDTYAIQAISQNNVIIEGSVISGDDAAIYTGSYETTPKNVSITLTAKGSVRSLNEDGVVLTDAGCTLDNAGSIVGKDDGVVLEGDDNSTVTVTNSGKISGSFGIYSDTTQTIVLTNSGTITATQYVFNSGDGGVNTSLVTNTGWMHGRLLLGLGNDLYDGRKGHVDNVVNGFNGNDRIYGGTEANVFEGGSGTDRLWGGRGADVFTGGTQADRFIYKALSDSTVAASGRDTITDFLHGTDHFDLAGLDANSKAKGDQAFHFLGSADFHHKAGELHMARSGADTVLSGDVNGDGRADFAITLSGHVGLGNGDFML